MLVRPETGAMVRPASEPRVPALRVVASKIPESEAFDPKSERPETLSCPEVVTFPVAWRPLERLRLPEKELEPVPDERYWPAVLKPPAVTVLVAVSDLERFNEPAKLLEPVELPVRVPVKVVLPVTPRVPPMVVLPPMLA